VDLADRKRRLRRELRQRLRAVAPGVAAEASRRAAAHLASSPELAGARRVILYAALADELPSRPLFDVVLDVVLDAGRPALLPRPGPGATLEVAPVARWEELAPGRYGVLEPPAARPGSALAPGDLILVPGVAFDREGHRLGRGRGWWDRTLAAACGVELTAVGVGFAFQVVEAVPYGPGDQALDAILTEDGWHRAGAGREP
jgi:5-formyltetrahydrofolate cyclo-ligase